MGAPPEVAYPGIRIKQWLDAFSSNAGLQSICPPEFTPALTQIAEVIARALSGVNCVPGVVSSKPDGTPDCRIVETSRNAAGVPMDVTLPFCSAGRLVVP